MGWKELTHSCYSILLLHYLFGDLPLDSVLTVVTWETQTCRASAIKLADQLRLSLSENPGIPEELTSVLHVAADGLKFISRIDQNTHQISAEFLKGPLGYRRLKGGGKQQLIAKAVGIKNTKQCLKVLDLTAGLGSDAFILASLGCKVRLVERSTLIAALLLDGLKRAKEAEGEVAAILRSMSVTIAEAKDVLIQLAATEAPDVIYLDPMFPHAKKSALAKIEMRIIRDIVGEDLDADELLLLALQKAKNRVVVKRPKLAPCLLGKAPSFVVRGKSNRFDVYLTIGNSNTL